MHSHYTYPGFHSQEGAGKPTSQETVPIITARIHLWVIFKQMHTLFLQQVSLAAVHTLKPLISRGGGGGDEVNLQIKCMG